MVLEPSIVTSNDETNAAKPQRIDLTWLEGDKDEVAGTIEDNICGDYDYVENLLTELKRCYEKLDKADEAMLTAREVLMKHHEWMSMNDATSEEDDQEILDVVKALREASE
jgi:lipopolysaccharide biosynthesis regulator YciM